MGKLQDLLIFKWLRDIKSWVEGYADRPGSSWILFFMSFCEAIFFPIPPDTLLIPMAFSFPKKALRFAAICTLGSVLGAVLGYGLGYLGSDVGQSIMDFYDPEQAVFGKIKMWFEQYGFWGVILAAITPIPFKIFTIASGVFEFNFITFIIASAIGRAFRFFLVSSMFYAFGKEIKPFIDKYFEILVILFSILLVGGFVAIKYLG